MSIEKQIFGTPDRARVGLIGNGRDSNATSEWRVTIAGALFATAIGLALLTSSNAAAQEWSLSEIGPGTKPALALTPEGSAVIVYMLESQTGWVRVASEEGDTWRIDEVTTGYFYGPPDIAIGENGTVHAAYHDHQAASFQPDKGDAVYLRRENGEWTSVDAFDTGHDGWDNRITVDGAGQPHMVGIDPLEFDGDGVEYYSLNEDGSWAVEQVGTGPQTYKYAISVAIDSEGTPWISYHDGSAKNLNLAHRATEGWQIETVDDASETGFFSELVIDGTGGQHISYYEMLDETSGIVRYAFRDSASDEWQISEVGRLDNVVLGFTGARNITSIDVDGEGSPSIAFSDESTLTLATLKDGRWETETVVEAAQTPLGQIVSLKLDGNGRPHIAYALVTSKKPLDGSIWHATRE